MKLKSKINILGQDISIKFRKNLVVQDKSKSGEVTNDDCDGAYISASNTIYLDEHLKTNISKLDDTFFHELGESICAMLEIDIDQHSKITQILTPLFGVLRTNKLIKPIDYSNIITEEDNGPL